MSKAIRAPDYEKAWRTASESACESWKWMHRMRAKLEEMCIEHEQGVGVDMGISETCKEARTLIAASVGAKRPEAPGVDVGATVQDDVTGAEWCAARALLQFQGIKDHDLQELPGHIEDVALAIRVGRAWRKL